MKNTTHRTRLLLASLGVAAVFAAVTVFAINSAPRPAPVAGVNQMAFQLPPTLPALAAADSDTVVLAPYTAGWWKKVVGMAPTSMALLQLDTAKATAPIIRVGYTRGPDHAKHDIPVTGPLRRVFIEAGSAEDASKLATWLKYAPGFEGRRVYVQERTVVVGQSWDTGFTVPEQSMATVAGYTPGDGAKQGSMWMNVDQELVTLAGGADTKAGKVYSAVLSTAIGFKPASTWTGFSDNGDAWKGDFSAGGIDKDQINIQDAREAVTSSEVVAFEAKSGNSTTRLINSGPADIINGSRISAGGKQMGGANAGSFPQIDGEVVSVVSDVTKWNSALTGNYSGAEAVAQRTLSANEKSMVLSFSYQDPATVGTGSTTGTGINNGPMTSLPKK
ncbi:MAG TPA: hypothetical protein VF867_01160 [Arthrobacter sp.]